MTTKKSLAEMLHAGNPHIRIDAGKDILEESRRWSLFGKIQSLSISPSFGICAGILCLAARAFASSDAWVFDSFSEEQNVPVEGGVYTKTFSESSWVDGQEEYFSFHGFQGDSIPSWATVYGELPDGRHFRHVDRGEFLSYRPVTLPSPVGSHSPILGAANWIVYYEDWDADDPKNSRSQVSYTRRSLDDKVKVTMTVEIQPNDSGKTRYLSVLLIGQKSYINDWGWVNEVIGMHTYEGDGDTTCYPYYMYFRQEAGVGIRFECNGGDELDAIYLRLGDNMPSLPVPVRWGYSFTGWTYENGEEVVVGEPLDRTITLYAGWEPVPHEWLYEEGEDDVSITGVVPSIGFAVMPNEIDGKPVKRIADGAFMENASLLGMMLSTNLVSIGANAFESCYDLRRVEISEGLKTIGDNAFAWCWHANIKLPESTAQIGDGAFLSCGNGDYASLVLPTSIERIGEDAFSGSGVREFCASNCVLDIGPGAFMSSFIERVFLADGFFNIGEDAFAYSACTGMIDIVLEEGVTNIGDRAFWCHDVKGRSVSIPGSVANIGFCAFGMTGIKDFIVSPENKRYSSVDGNLCDKTGEILLQGAWGTTIAIPERIKYIGPAAYMYYDVGGKLILPSGIRRIMDNAFVGCGFKELKLNKGLLAIGSGAFMYCEIKDVHIPESVVEIGDSAFSGCWEMKRFVFHGDAPIVGDNAFYGVPNTCEAYVSRGSTGWNVNFGENWNGLILRESYSLPEKMEDDNAVRSVFSDFEDTNLMEHVTTKKEYASLYNWVVKEDVYAQDVKESPYGWTAFALDAPALLGKEELTSDDIMVTSIESQDGNGDFSLEIAIDGVEIGDNASSERIVDAFGIEGATNLSDVFSANNVELKAGEPTDGKVKLTVEPKTKDAKSFFMRVRLK